VVAASKYVSEMNEYYRPTGRAHAMTSAEISIPQHIEHRSFVPRYNCVAHQWNILHLETRRDGG
jgi:hypothetical protein